MLPRFRGLVPAAPGVARRQHGFTLIEMLVVMAILGILAAVVTISMIGVTDLATRRAQDGELMAVQSAMNFMLMDQLVGPEHACDLFAGGAGGVKDMRHFPSDEAYRTSGGMGHATDGTPVSLWPHYLRKRMMSRSYTCTAGGTVTPGRVDRVP